MEKYANGKIYAIKCRKTGKTYIGSTCEPTLAKRLAKHTSSFKKWLETEKSFCASFDIIKDGDYYIVLLESYSCNSRDELRMCEQKHIDLCECVNKNKSFISDEEKLEQMKQYHKHHRDKILEQKKIYYETHYDEKKTIS